MDTPNDSNSSDGKKPSYIDPTVGSGHMFTAGSAASAGSKAENIGETVSSGPKENRKVSSVSIIKKVN
jgi:hypothetical protein